MKRRSEGFRKPFSDPKAAKPIGLARISYAEDGSASCSCGGWARWHPRREVLENSIDRHLAKRHGGRGFRL